MIALHACKKLSTSRAPTPRHWTQTQGKLVLPWEAEQRSRAAADQQWVNGLDCEHFLGSFLAFLHTASRANPAQLCMLTFSSITLKRLTGISSNFRHDGPIHALSIGVWLVTKIQNSFFWPSDGSQPFVLRGKEVPPKMITSYLVVFGPLSRMVNVRGACDKPSWIYKQLNNSAAPRRTVMTFFRARSHRTSTSAFATRLCVKFYATLLQSLCRAVTLRFEKADIRVLLFLQYATYVHDVAKN